MKKTMWLSVAILSAAALFVGCQKQIISTEEDAGFDRSVTRKASTNTYPDTVNVGEAFSINAAITCGKVAIERAYILDANLNKVYVGLTCETSGLLWEDVIQFQCPPGATANNLVLNVPGTYVYRTKHNGSAGNCNPAVTCNFNGNQFTCFVITAVQSCNIDGNEFTGTVLNCAQTGRSVEYVFGSEEGVADFKMQGGLNNFTGANADVYINDVLVNFNSTSPDGWATGVVGGFTVGQRTPGGSTNRNIRVEGSLGECTAVKVRIVWNSTNGGSPITGEWTVKKDDVNLADPVPGLICN